MSATSQTKRSGPWWQACFFDNFIRRLIQQPVKLLGPYVQPGMTVLDAGCGLGIFTLGMARLLGGHGQVVAVDVRPKALNVLVRRAYKKKLLDRMEIRTCTENSLAIEDMAGRIDFALASYVVHEVADAPGFLAQVADALKPGGRFLVMEPRGHVSQAAFEQSLARAGQAGFRELSRPEISFSRAALLGRPVG